MNQDIINKMPIGLLAPPFIIGFLDITKSSVQTLLNIWPLESHIWSLFTQIHIQN